MSRLWNASGFTLLLGLLLFGCATRDSGYKISEETIAFIHPGTTSRAEVIENLGPPLLEMKNPNVVAYSWGKERATGHRASLADQGLQTQQAGYTSIPATSTGADPELVESRRWICCIALDDSDHVTRIERIELQGAGSLERAISEWAAHRK